MASDLDIANMALFHLGVTGAPIADLVTDRTKEAKAVRRFFSQVREEALRDYPWGFATHIDQLALVEEEPTTEWLFAYRYPDNCLTIRRMLPLSSTAVSFFNAPTVRYPLIDKKLAKYRIGRDNVGKLVYTNMEAPVAEWTELLTDPTDYPPDFIQAMSLKLAMYIAPAVTGGDKLKLGDRAGQLYVRALAIARQNDGNESNLDQDLGPSELEQARD